MKYQDGGLAGRKMARLGAKILPGVLVSGETKLENKKATEYDKVKKGMTQAFKDKRNLYVNDAPTINKFMDNNRVDLLEMIYYSKLVPGKWINKEKTDEKTKVTEAITKEINEYKKDVSSKPDASEDKSGSPEEGKKDEGKKGEEGKKDEGKKGEGDAVEGDGEGDGEEGKKDEGDGDGDGEDKKKPQTGGGGRNKSNNKIKTRKNKRYNNKTRRNNNT